MCGNTNVGSWPLSTCRATNAFDPLETFEESEAAVHVLAHHIYRMTPDRASDAVSNLAGGSIDSPEEERQ